MKNYIGGRRHLQYIINKMYSYDLTTRKFAEVLSGEKSQVLLGYPEAKIAKYLGVNSRAKILLKKNYALHMDNSGHFTGIGYGARGHNDPSPLSMSQLSKIPYIIKTAQMHEIQPDKKVRGLQRYRITRKMRKKQIIVVEVSIKRNEIDLVTAYNLVKKRHPHNRRRLLSRG